MFVIYEISLLSQVLHTPTQSIQRWHNDMQPQVQSGIFQEQRSLNKGFGCAKFKKAAKEKKITQQHE